MKKNLFIIGFFFMSSQVEAQMFKNPSLQESVSLLNSSQTEPEFERLFNIFSTADTSEKWLAHYYSAVSLYLKTDLLLNKFPTKPLKEPNNLALKYAKEALELEKNNPEITILLGLIYSQRIQILNSPEPNKDLNLINNYIAKVDSSLRNSPRLTYLKYYIAEKSGNKEEALKLLRKAIKEFETSTNSSVKWGKQLIQNN